MKLIMNEEAREGAIRVYRAWELFFETKSGIPEGHRARLIPFTNWLWDELGKKAGYLNRNSGKELTLAIPAFGQEALDYLLRIASFLGRRGPCQEEGRSNLREPLEEAGRQRLRRQ